MYLHLHLNTFEKYLKFQILFKYFSNVRMLSIPKISGLVNYIYQVLSSRVLQ